MGDSTCQCAGANHSVHAQSSTPDVFMTSVHARPIARDIHSIKVATQLRILVSAFVRHVYHVGAHVAQAWRDTHCWSVTHKALLQPLMKQRTCTASRVPGACSERVRLDIAVAPIDTGYEQWQKLVH